MLPADLCAAPDHGKKISEVDEQKKANGKARTIAEIREQRKGKEDLQIKQGSIMF